MPVSTAAKTLPEELKEAEKQYNVKLPAYIAANRPYWSGKAGVGGTLNNLETGLAWMMTLGKTGLATGCLDLQAQTYSAIKPHVPSGWDVRFIKVGFGAEHHSVVVFKSKSTYTEGYVFDPWINQKPEIWTYSEWSGQFTGLSMISSIKLE